MPSSAPLFCTALLTLLMMTESMLSRPTVALYFFRKLNSFLQACNGRFILRAMEYSQVRSLTAGIFCCVSVVHWMEHRRS